MDGLQRSEISFRRQGSSGLVWDDKFLSGELKQIRPKQEEEEKDKAAESREHTYRTVKVEPTIDPPSPKISGCGICGMFGKPVAPNKHSVLAIGSR
ncbi:hypothetical protein F0562_030077 [Nyssa sinensis]|uniref:MAPK kinase substrate protein n=1 Tax=Nyssa sinensis TaxID=561372 RepID=A0A5J5AXG7_9ASTE|nr:hypothetical protein F0562_030077 [Nyssa sinensis]